MAELCDIENYNNSIIAGDADGDGDGNGDGHGSIGIGLDLRCVPDLHLTLTKTIDEYGFSFIMTPLVHPRRKRSLGMGVEMGMGMGMALTRSELAVSCDQWRNHVVGTLLSPQVDLASDDLNAFLMLKQEMEFATHLGLSAISLPTIPSTKSIHFHDYARAIYSICNSGTAQCWIPLELDACSWHRWHRLHAICAVSPRLAPVLVLGEDLPDAESLQNWAGEGVAAVILPLGIFSTSPHGGTPELSSSHEKFLRKFLELDVRVILRPRPLLDLQADLPDLLPYCRYLQELAHRVSMEDTEPDLAKQYRDFLQVPLQPLMDNLSTQTYEVFERDPVKYREYERAIGLAIRDINARLSRANRDGDGDGDGLVVMVVGAGRGPLVTATLNAARSRDVPVTVFAIEKNPNAVITLLGMRNEVWGASVTVVHTDMRKWEAPCKAHILVSELLGSFGDNELSPECLDGAERFLRDDGVSIPSSYTSYLQPITCSRLWAQIRGHHHNPTIATKSLETPHVVNLHNYVPLAQPQPCFTFHHPRKSHHHHRGVEGDGPSQDSSSDDTYHPHPNHISELGKDGKATIDESNNHHYHHHPQANARAIHLDFEVDGACVVHGFAGYFSTVLYGDVMLSIEPSTISKGMFSWFPIFFPLQQPLSIPSTPSPATVRVHMWRRVQAEQRKVWYEWSAETLLLSHHHLHRVGDGDGDGDGIYATTTIHNTNGRSYWIGL